MRRKKFQAVVRVHADVRMEVMAESSEEAADIAFKWATDRITVKKTRGSGDPEFVLPVKKPYIHVIYDTADVHIF